MPFYYVQDIFQKNQLGKRLDKKTVMTPEVNIMEKQA